jgi:hypothetical protein
VAPDPTLQSVKVRSVGPLHLREVEMHCHCKRGDQCIESVIAPADGLTDLIREFPSPSVEVSATNSAGPGENNLSLEETR